MTKEVNLTTKESYQRIGRQIVEFLNRYLNERVKLNPGIGFKVKIDNYNMPQEDVDKVDGWLRKRLATLIKMPQSLKVDKEIAKVLGKYCHK